MGTRVLAYLLFFSLPFYFLYMPTITTTGAHTSHAKLCFYSTDGNLICLPTPRYVALGTHYLLSLVSLFFFF